MPRRDVGRLRATRGFSLIEVLVAISLLSLLAGALAPLGIRSLRAAQLEKTRRAWTSLLRAMAGDSAQGDFGYLGDMGNLPGSLADLNDRTGKPAFAVDASDGVGYGWAGPYAPAIAAAGAPVVDAWSVALQFDGVTAQLRSAGADRQFGTADDLMRPFAPFGHQRQPRRHGFRRAKHRRPGRAARLLARGRLRGVLVVGGVRNEQLMGGGGPVHGTNGLHLGLHGLRAVGAGSYSGAPWCATSSAIKRGSTHRTLVLEQP